MALGTGDIAITGISTEGDGSLAFVALKAIGGGEVVRFTNNEWNGSAIGAGGAWIDTQECAWTWTAPAEGLAAGQIVVFGSLAAPEGEPTVNVGTAAFDPAGGNNRGFGSGSDVVYAYSGDSFESPSSFLTAISTTSSAYEVNGDSPQGQGYDIIVVAGQSNAAGFGTGPFFDPLASPETDASIKQISRADDATDMSVAPIGYMAGGVLWDGLDHWDGGAKTNMGFALPFARSYVESSLAEGRQVLIVPAAFGGTRIDYWLQTTPFFHDGEEVRLYDDMLARTQAALGQPGENRIVGLLWHQGEADATLIPIGRSSEDVYHDQLTALLDKMRADLQPEADFPIILGGLSTVFPDDNPHDSDPTGGRAAIESAIDAVAAELGHVGVASSFGITVRSDGVHFDAAGQVEFGRRYYEAWLEEVREMAGTLDNTGLSFGVNAVQFPGGIGGLTGAAYEEPRGEQSSFADWLASISNPSNWTTYEGAKGGMSLPLSGTPFTLQADITVDDVSVTEGDAGEQVLTFTVSRSHNEGAFTLDFATADGTAAAGSDYAALTGSLNFEVGGALSQTISITVNGDEDIETDEALDLLLSNLVATSGTAALQDASGSGTILNDDFAAEVSVSDVSVSEGDSGEKVLTFKVTRSDNESAFTIDFATSDGSASAGIDYTALSGALSFERGGDLTQDVSVTITGDNEIEADESFQLVLSNLVGSSGNTILKNEQATGTIVADDFAAEVSVGDVSIAEGDAGTRILTFTVTRSNNESAFTLDFATADNTAQSGSDYEGVKGSLNFVEGGDLTQAVSVTVFGDEELEPDESFQLVLSNLVQSSGAAILADGEASGNVLTDDVAAQVSISDVSLAEGNEGNRVLTFTVTRSHNDGAFTLNFATADDTALAASDYLSTSGSLNFATGGSLTQAISVTLRGDREMEADENVRLVLSKLVSSSGVAVLTDAEAFGTIMDDDLPTLGNDFIVGTAEDDLIDLLAGDDVFRGLDGDDVIDGGLGADKLTGGKGNDLYYVDNSGDFIVELVNEGTTDRVATSVSFVLTAGAEVESLTTRSSTSFAALNLTGNSLAQTITGNNGANAISDGGGRGADVLKGLGGDDTYLVRSGATVIRETEAGGSNDRVAAGVSYSLASGAHVEVLTTTSSGGTTAINLSGNEFGQTINGNAGNNLIDGGGGADVMIGGLGDDTYFVDHASDKVTEKAAAGFDRILTSVSYTLDASTNVELLAARVATEVTAINLTGNNLAQQITGNAGDNVINGNGGVDTMAGGGGNDTFYVDNVGDIVVEATGEGTLDKVGTSVSYALGTGVEVEWLSTRSSSGTSSINLTGNEVAQTINGNAGNNVVEGRAGADRLSGGQGQDAFVFNTTLDAETNIDLVADFSGADDMFLLDNEIFSAIMRIGPLLSGYFKNLNSSGAVVDTNDRILYDRANGDLFYDADGSGSGAAIQFAEIGNKVALTFSDFLVI